MFSNPNKFFKNIIIPTIIIITILFLSFVLGYFNLIHKKWFPMFQKVERTYTEIANPPTELIDGFQSYQSIEKVKQFLESKSISWEVIEDSKLRDDDKRPPFNIYTVSIKNYNYLGCSGELLLHFFNNRLMSTVFYPKDIEGFLDTLKRIKKISFENGHEATISPYTKVTTYTDFKGHKYVGWVDSLLIEEMDLWISIYS
jgi:hypothetical protein